MRDVTRHETNDQCRKIGTHCVHVGSSSVELIDALVSMARAGCFALEKKKHAKQLNSSSKIVSLRSQRFRGIQMYKISLCRVIYARAADLFLYGHSLYMPGDIVGRTTHKNECAGTSRVVFHFYCARDPTKTLRGSYNLGQIVLENG